MDYSWPGNVRELENVIEYLMVTTEGDTIHVSDLPENISEQDRGSMLSLENVSSMKEAVGIIHTASFLSMKGVI